MSEKPRFNARARRRAIHGLTRRAEYLQGIVNSYDREEMRGINYDIAELEALRWAIEAIRQYYPEKVQP